MVISFGHRILASDPWLVARRTACRALDPQKNSVYSPARIFEGLRA